MDEKPADTSACPPSNTAPLGEQNGLPSTGKPFRSRASALSGVDQPGACPKKIHEWTDRANISFEYTKKKIDDLLNKAKKKIAEKLDCNQLECTQCNDSFPGESELRKHYHSEEHLAKVREKSESKILGDLKTFARVRQFILSRILGPPAQHLPLQGQTAASLPSDQPSSPAAANEPPVGCPFDEWLTVQSLLSPIGPNEEEMDKGLDEKIVQVSDITKLREEVDRLQRENGDLKQHNKQQEEENREQGEEIRKLKERLHQKEKEMSPECLQPIVVEVKKNETKEDLKKGDLGYEFDNDKYYRIMDVLKQQYSSVQELVANLVTCSVKVNRKGGGYGERQSNGGRNEEEKASKKRKRADEAKM